MYSTWPAIKADRMLAHRGSGLLTNMLDFPGHRDVIAQVASYSAVEYYNAGFSNFTPNL
jgi:hypothetical protein